MKKSIRSIVKLATLTLISWPLLFSSPIFAQTGVGTAQLTKLAKQFNVSPDVLSSFKNMSLKDMQSGLNIAQQVSGKGALSMDAATKEVMGAASSGKGWDSIATDFGVDASAGKSSGKTSTKGPSIPGKSNKKLLN